MPTITISGRDSADKRTAPNMSFRPNLEMLDDRALPSTVSNLISRQPLDSSGNDPFAGVDAAVEIIGSSDNGNFLLLQTAATNIATDYLGTGPQITAPGQINLFWYDVTSAQAKLVTAFDPPAAVPLGLPSFTAGQKGLGVEVSTRDDLKAVISGDGATVAFLSSANAFYFDSTLANGLASDGGGNDVFLWNAATGRNSLVSRMSTGVAIGGFGQVSNPALAPDGTSASFISSVPAYQIMGLTQILTRIRTSVISSAPNINQLPPGIAGLTQDYLVRDSDNSPDIFRAVVGKTPVPISYDPVTFGIVYVDNNNRLVNVAVDRYVMHGNIQVDPLNRYATAGNAKFAAMRNWSIYDGNNTRGKDAWTYGYDPTFAVAVGKDPVVRTVAFTAKDQVTEPGFSALGTVDNVFSAQGSGDLFFLYRTLGKSNNGFLLNNYVSGNGNDNDLWRVRTGAAGERPELLTAAVGTTNVGANGLLDTSTAAAYDINPDGTKLIFTSTATNLVTGLIDNNLAFDIFQRDLTNNPITGGKIFAMSVLNSNPLVTGNAESRYPKQTPDGLAVTFETTGTNFTSIPDGNQTTDIFVRDVVRGQTLLASATDGNQSTGNARSYGAVVVRTSQLDVNFYRNFQVFYSSLSTNIDVDYTVTPGLAQVYGTKFPIFISQLAKPFAYSDSNGNVFMATTNPAGKVVTSTKYTPIPGYRGELRVATGDFNGDGVIDVAVGVGPGGGPRVVILDGFNGRVLDDFFAFERTFTGGVYVATGDLTGDGKADLIVGAGEGGAPRVQIYDSITGIPLMDFFAYESTARTGVRVAAGDFNADTAIDLYIAAGIGGGPRVRIFDGKQLPNPVVLSDFFAYESTLRGGAYISTADFDADNRSDIVVGAGPEGGPRVTIYNAANVNLRDPNLPVTFSDFFAFDQNLRTGVRPILRDIDSDKYGDLIVGLGSGLPQIRTYIGKTIRETGDPSATDDIFAGGALLGQFGAWVG
jgi:hypothetical protein